MYCYPSKACIYNPFIIRLQAYCARSVLTAHAQSNFKVSWKRICPPSVYHRCIIIHPCIYNPFIIRLKAYCARSVLTAYAQCNFKEPESSIIPFKTPPILCPYLPGPYPHTDSRLAQPISCTELSVSAVVGRIASSSLQQQHETKPNGDNGAVKIRLATC